MSVLMRVIATNSETQGFTEFDKPTWLMDYDIEAHDGRGSVHFTTNRSLARRFADAPTAFATWKRVSTTRPTRPDGKPNRPLSALTVEIEPE